MMRSLKHLSVFLVWNLVIGLVLVFARPLYALPLSLGLYALLLWGYLLRSPAGGEAGARRDDLRLHPLSGSRLRWSIAAVPVVLILSWAIGDVYTRLIPVPAESLNPFEEILDSPDGRLLISVFAIGIAPIVEEFVFRGLIQREFERRHGAAIGILGAAALFALVHLLPWVFPLHFFLGATFGFVVWATRSIWAGVLLHTANNTAAMLGFAFTSEEPPPTGTLWEFGVTADLWLSVGILAVTGSVAFWMAGKLIGLREGVALPTDSERTYLR